MGRRVGGSRLRRIERRAAARQLEAEQVENAEEADKSEVDEKAEAVKAGKAAEVAVITEDTSKLTVGETSIAAVAANKSTNDDSNTIAEKAHSTNEMEVNDDSDCDVYIFTYWDNFKASKAQDALDYLEKTLKQNFKNFKVKDSDQIYKADKIDHLDENEIEVKIKLQKNNRSVERVARNVQTAYLPKTQFQSQSRTS